LDFAVQTALNDVELAQPANRMVDTNPGCDNLQMEQ
jgi:hypothetical protein